MNSEQGKREGDLHPRVLVTGCNFWFTLQVDRPISGRRAYKGQFRVCQQGLVSLLTCSLDVKPPHNRQVGRENSCHIS